MATSVKIVTERLGGVRLTSAADPGFNQQLAAIYGQNASEVARLQPFLVMLSNESNRKVVAYTVTSTISFQDGRVGGQHRCLFRYPDAAQMNTAMPRGREIFPEERRVVALLGWEIDPGLKDFAFHARQFADIQKGDFPETTKNVDVALDAIIDDSGVLTGPDTAGLVNTFLDHLRAKRSLYQRLLDSPAPAELLRSLFNDPHAHDLKPGLTQEAMLQRLWRRLAIEDAHQLLSEFGEQRLLQAIQEALRNQELVIHREPSER